MCFSVLRASRLGDLVCCVMTDSVAANRLGLKRHPRFLRPEKIALTESLVELRMARRYGWNLDMLRGKLSTPEAKRGDSYRLLNPRPLLFQPRPRIDVVRLSHWLRFGNAVRQLKHVFYVAEQLGAQTVEFAELHPFFEGQLADHFELVWGNRPSSAPTLVGEFLNARTFHLRLKASEIARVLHDLVRPLLAAHLREPDPRVNRDDLILHFRADDIFKEQPPHPKYGQPPLSYYLAAVEREQPARVWLVFEDYSNPCVEAAEAALRACGVKVLMQSGTLEEDLRVLLSASQLVGSRCSFADAIAYLSERLQRAHFFEPKTRIADIRALRELGVEVIVARDADGEFKENVLNDSWINSAEQRALMLSYPVDKLLFENVTVPPSSKPALSRVLKPSPNMHSKPIGSGRIKTWFKTKCFTESTFVVVGTDRDKKTGALRALLAHKDSGGLKYAGAAFIALSGDDRTRFFAELERLATSWAAFKSSRLMDVKWCQPKLKVEVKHLAGSKMLRHATVKRLAT
jgi:hypothetical protein